jgi:hypothetical protein
MKRRRQLGICEWCKRAVFAGSENDPAKWHPLSVDVWDPATRSEYVAYVHFGCYVENGSELRTPPPLVLP